MFRILVQIIEWLINILRYWNNKTCCRTRIVSNVDEALQILRSADYSRDQHNAWMRETFSIVNPFTINSTILLKAFKNNATKMLANWNNENYYEELVFIVAQRIQYRLTLLKFDDSEVCLSKLIQQVTLDVFLSAILNINADNDLISQLPSLITYLWKNHNDRQVRNHLNELILKHKHTFLQSETWQQIRTILSTDSNVMSKINTNDFDEKVNNPLNIIIPGWETMWRVVFYTLLELLRHSDLLKELRSKLDFDSKSYRTCQLLKWILRETLRLYPPTKNIYRTNLKTGEKICISVQRIHRNEDVWGSNALEYYPYRFQSTLTVEQEKSYIPFSISCPARFTFGYNFAGTIVAEIVRHCPTFSVAPESLSFLAHNLLNTNRDAYKDLVIII